MHIAADGILDCKSGAFGYRRVYRNDAIGKLARSNVAKEGQQMQHRNARKRSKGKRKVNRNKIQRQLEGSHRRH
jgi:hypothetical protein